MPDRSHVLAATCRCLQVDLTLDADACALDVEELRDRHPVIACFLDKRRETPIGQELIRQLAPRVMAFSLHCGRHRGATWHHEALGTVWLLAAALHRDDSPEDAYAHFARLRTGGTLLPTREDIQRQVDRRASSWATSVVTEVPVLRDQARSEPGIVHEVVLGGRVRLRVLYEAGSPSILSVAIGQRLIPGSVGVPPEWQTQLLAALFPAASFEDIGWIPELGTGHPLSDDEIGYCAFDEPGVG